MITCPNCNSKNLRYFEDRSYTYDLKLDKNNEPTDKVIHKNLDYIVNAYGYFCNDCGYRFGGSLPMNK